MTVVKRWASKWIEKADRKMLLVSACMTEHGVRPNSPAKRAFNWVHNQTTRELRRRKLAMVIGERRAGYIEIIDPDLLPLVLSTVRQRRGQTLRDVEEVTGISNAMLSQIENGRTRAGIDTLVTLTQWVDRALPEDEEEYVCPKCGVVPSGDGDHVHYFQ